MGSIIGSESGADVIQASGQASWADLVWIKMLKYMKGQHITSHSGINLDTELGCSFSAGTCRQLCSGVCFIAPWGAYIPYHYLFGMGVSHGTIVDCINEQFIMCGCSLSVALHGQRLQLSHWVGCHGELSHLEACGPCLHIWHLFYHSCQGSGCGS